jgi:hypothetical protein
VLARCVCATVYGVGVGYYTNFVAYVLLQRTAPLTPSPRLSARPRGQVRVIHGEARFVQCRQAGRRCEGVRAAQHRLARSPLPLLPVPTPKRFRAFDHVYARGPNLTFCCAS